MSCRKNARDEARNASYNEGKGRSNVPKARSKAPPQKAKIRQPNAMKVNCHSSIHASTSGTKDDPREFYGANTTKPKKVWVVKT